MIRCPASHLRARCIERGYAWKDIEACIVAYEGEYLLVDETNPAYPASKKPPGLGDMVKAGLSAFGITEERVSKAIGKPCGCSERAEKLNELGHKYLGLPPGESSASS